MVHIAVSISVILAVFICQSTAIYVPTITCSAPVPPENGYFRPVKSHYPVGWKVVFLCNEGFELSGYSQSVCKLSFYFRKIGVWSFPPPVCKRKHLVLLKMLLINHITSNYLTAAVRNCPALSAPQDGKVRVSGTNPGDRADYSCNGGFSLKGVGWRKCQDNGQWTGEAPTCESERMFAAIFMYASLIKL